MPVYFNGYMHGLKVDEGKKQASVLQCKNRLGMKHYLTLYSPRKILSGKAVRNYCTLQKAYELNQNMSFQILNAVSISK